MLSITEEKGSTSISTLGKEHSSNTYSRTTAADLALEASSLWQGLLGFEWLYMADKDHLNHRSLAPLVVVLLLKLFAQLMPATIVYSWSKLQETQLHSHILPNCLKLCNSIF